ncbi:hypothetical protein BJ912DRAFT_623658 [Pholiota molesta]|nr:hypothetical protein BJ912DRAFT_623658 [Pholiota molesta]
MQDDAQSTFSSIALENAQDERSATGERVPVSADTSGGPGHDVPDSVASKVISSLHASRANAGTADVKPAPSPARQEDTEAKPQPPSQAQPVHRHTPVTKGREHPLAPHEEILGTAPGAQITTGVNPASPQRPHAAESKPGSESTGWERVDSSRATPGHGPPPVPQKDDAGMGAPQKSAQPATGVGAVAASAAAGAGAAGDVAGMATPVIAPTTAPTKPAHAHAHGAPPNGHGGRLDGTEAKKPGFFEKLKKEVRALSGKHHKEDSAGKHALKN